MLCSCMKKIDSTETNSKNSECEILAEILKLCPDVFDYADSEKPERDTPKAPQIASVLQEVERSKIETRDATAQPRTSSGKGSKSSTASLVNKARTLRSATPSKPTLSGRTLLPPDGIEEVIRNYSVLVESLPNPEENSSRNGILPPSLIIQLKTETRKLTEYKVLLSVANEELLRVLLRMHEFLITGSSSSPPKDVDLLNKVDAVSTIICILGYPDIPKQLLISEVVDSVYSFMEESLRKDIFQRDSSDDSGTLRQSQRHRLLVAKIFELLQELGSFCENQLLEDRQVLQTTSLAVDIFFSRQHQELRHHAAALMIIVFKTYPAHRAYILDDLCRGVVDLGCERRGRSYQMEFVDGYVYASSALFIQLIQVAALSSSKLSSPTNLNSSTQCAQYLVDSLLIRCGKKSSEQDLPVFMRHFVDDLVLLLPCPEWPAAEVILYAMCQRHSFLLSLDDGDDAVSRIPKTFCIEQLGFVLAGVRKLQINIIEQLRGDDAIMTELPPQASCAALFLGFLEAKSDTSSELKSCYTLHKDTFQIGNSVDSMGRESSDAGFSQELAEFVHFMFMLKRPLMQNFDKYLSKVSCYVSHRQLKTKAVKAISLIVDSDATALKDDLVMECMLSLTTDDKVVVRESAMDILAKGILHRPELLPKFGPGLIDRMKDKSLKIRKHAIHLLHQVCQSLENAELIASVCEKLLDRIDDPEPSLRDLVDSIFPELLLGLGFRKYQRTPQNRKITQTWRDIVPLVSKSTVNDPNRFEAVIKLSGRFLKKAKEGQDEKPLSSFAYLETLASSIVDYIVTSEVRAENLEFSSILEESLCGLMLLAKLLPSCLSNHLGTLCRYLSLDISSSASLQYAISIFHLALPTMLYPDERLVSDVEDELVKIFKTQKPELVGSSAKTLCMIKTSGISNRPELVSRLFDHLYTFLSSVGSVHEKSSLVARASFSIGMLCRYGEIRDNKVIESVYELCQKFIVQEDIQISIAALQGVGQLWICQPSLITKESCYLEGFLSPTADKRLMQQALRIIVDYLVFEEDQTKISAAAHSVTKEGKDIWNQDESMGTGLAQQYSSRIIHQTLHPDVEVRKAALAAVKIMLRQGMIVPTTCVPHLVAIMVDPHSEARSQASNLFEYILQRSASCVRCPQLLEGIKLGFQAFCDLTKESNENVLGFQLLLESLEKNISLRKNLIQQLLSPGFLDALKEMAPEVMQGFVLYCFKTLSMFPFSVEHDVLFVIYHANLLISLESSLLLDHLKQREKSAPVETRLSRLVAAVSLKNFLVKQYCISREKCINFSLYEDRRASGTCIRPNQTACNFDVCRTIINANSEACYKMLKKILDSDPTESFTNSHKPTAAVLKRKNPHDSAQAPQPKRKRTQPKRGTRTRLTRSSFTQVSDDSSEDEKSESEASDFEENASTDSDEDWEAEDEE
eukprot:TRINITY_DN2656_c0_g1_i2.p1 TRINITY_DN2656_c0_g1~~TRINITY_DN2656_c0_g1_i2.p1  ORF type:complete len:1425 (+),score=262.42 TRINITY_DN2656_c0_g1_i2:706-4980(+)